MIIVILVSLVIFIFTAKKVYIEFRKWMDKIEQKRIKMDYYKAEYQKELIKAKSTEQDRTGAVRKNHVKKRFKKYIENEKKIEAEIDEKLSDWEKIRYFLDQDEGDNIINMYLEDRMLVSESKLFEADGGDRLNEMDDERWEYEKLMIRKKFKKEAQMRATDDRLKTRLRRVK
jgi:hypothetical protein